MSYERNYNGVKQILWYLKDTKIWVYILLTHQTKFRWLRICMLFFLDPRKARSQTSYTFLIEGIAISWRTQKQTLVATSSNHAEVITLHVASRECIWLRSSTTQFNFLWTRQARKVQLWSMKIIQLVSHEWRNNTSRVIAQNI